MSYLPRFADEHLPAFNQYKRSFLILGIILVILGCLAVGASIYATVISIVFLGCVLLFGGVVLFLDSMAYWRRKKGFVLHFLISLLYLVAGFMLVVNPLAASIPLTLLLGIFYVMAGVFRLTFSSALQAPHWGWGWLNGALSLLIGILIIMSWPASSLFIIGLFVGIDLLFSGWTYIMFSFAAGKKVVLK